MEKYLEGGELTESEIKVGLRERTLAREIVPVCVVQPLKIRGTGNVGCCY